ncbi:MAG: PEGA domain-containing protein [Bacteroidetes bacterium]|nr:PEGA domain-containing protein [Bacteroidota bacterium]
MKKLILISLLLITSSNIFGQSAYIEIKGEPNLSVYLNSKFKGKTTSEFNGLILENVSPGTNLIKIVKDGYTPFEESITIKPGEVLAYKVKPFTKHKVYVSEEGNTAETKKTTTVKTGKLIIQSVPIEIKITIPEIDGINNSSKTKDKWLADEIPTGNYKITFTYNQKIITKTIEVIGNETTSLFVNMLSGDFKTSNTLDEKKKIESEEYLTYNEVLNFINSFCAKYKFKPGLTESEFRSYNLEASNTIKTQNPSWIKSNGLLYYIKGKKNENEGPKSIYIVDGIVTDYSLCLLVGNKENTTTQLYFTKLIDEIKNTIPSKYIYKYPPPSTAFMIMHPKIKTSFMVTLNYYNPSSWGNTSEVVLQFYSK